MTPRLGATVTFNLRDVLFRGDGVASNVSGRWPKVWKRLSYQPNRVVDGILIGVRTLSEGDVVWAGHDEPTYYQPTDYLTAYLVAYDLRRRPVYLLPGDVTFVPEDRGERIRAEVEAMRDEAAAIMGRKR